MAAAKAMILGNLDIIRVASRATPGEVRALLGAQLLEWGLVGLADDLFLVAGELITNAVEATPGQEIRVRLAREAEGVLLAVWDASDRAPVAKPVVELVLDDIAPDAAAPDPGHDDGTGGWGLPIVEALSSECGLRRTEPHGKWVWARMGRLGLRGSADD
ncbi:ATP-binding protein [Spirillospora sp. CA-294931]|uniref:ATP-binding protein n=1 Tax=Spirillospora sp. CA-294931 TaxID=3240042 RepID=UPI003D94A5A9